MSAVIIRPVVSSLQKMIDCRGGKRAAEALRAAAENLAGIEDRLAAELDEVLDRLRGAVEGRDGGRPGAADFAEIRRLAEHALSLCGPLGEKDLAAAVRMLAVQADALSGTVWWTDRALGPAMDLVCLSRAAPLPPAAFTRLMEQLQLCLERYRDAAARPARPSPDIR